MTIHRLLVTVLADPPAPERRLRLVIHDRNEGANVELARAEVTLPKALFTQTRTALRSIEHQADLERIGAALWQRVWDAADTGFRQALEQAAVHRPDARIELLFASETTTDPECALAEIRSLPWEGFPRNLGNLVRFGYCHFIRVHTTTRTASDSVVGRFRILLLIGNFDQLGHRLHTDPAPAWTSSGLVESIRTALGKSGSLHLEVHCTPAALRGCTGDSIGQEIDPASVTDLLAKPWDIVHVFAHGSPSKPAARANTGTAEHDAVDLGDGHLLSADTLAKHLSDRTRIVLLQACSCREAFVAALSSKVDHIIGTAGKLAPKDIWAPFYGNLAKRLADFRVVAGLQAIREALWNAEHRARSADQEPGCPWLIPVHFSAVHGDLPFGGSFARDLAIYARGIKPHLPAARLPGVGSLDLPIRLAIAPPALAKPLELLGPTLTGPEDLPHPAPGIPGPHRLTLRHLVDLLDDRGRSPTPAARSSSVLRSVLLIGDPGGGKTTALQQLAVDLLAGDSDTVPIYVRLPSWASSRHCDLDSLLAHAGKRLPREARQALFSVQSRTPRLLVLLDGYDELTDKQLGKCHDLLVNLDTDTVDNLFVVLASRPHALPREPGRLPDVLQKMPRATLLRLEHDDKVRILRHRLGDRGDEVGAALVNRRTPESVRALTGSPLFLTILADLVQALPSGDARPLRKWLHSFRDRSHFYDAILDTLIRGSHRAKEDRGRPVTTESDAQRSLEKLEDLADAMTRAGTPFFSRAQAQLHVSNALLNRLCSRSGVLQPVEPDRQHSRVQFWHRSLQEMLTARRLLRSLEKPTSTSPETGWRRLQEAVSERLRIRGRKTGTDILNWWTEPLALVTSALTSRSRSERLDLKPRHRQRDVRLWLRMLTRGQERDLLQQNALRRIGLASLFAADSRFLDDRIVMSAMQDCADLDWEDRRPVYDLLGTLPPSVRLIDRLRRWLKFWSERERLGTGFLSRRELAAIDAVLWPIAHGEEAGLRTHAETARREALDDFGLRDRRSIQDRMVVPGREGDYWATVPPGWFLFGTGTDVRALEFTRGFRLGCVAVTLDLYRAFAPAHQNSWPASGADPVTDVTWPEAALFCRWLRHRLGLPVRLPTEVEYEAAIRGTVRTRQLAERRRGENYGRTAAGKRVTDTTLDRVAWTGAKATPRNVASLEPTAYGIHDLLGNVWHWCATRWTRTLPAAASCDAALVSQLGLGDEQKDVGAALAGDPRPGDDLRVIRGGSSRCPPHECQVGTRFAYDPKATFITDLRGFRLLLDRSDQPQ